MTKVKSFGIYFYYNKTVYHPGDTVKAKCVLELARESAFRCLRVTMRGRAKVQWTEARTIPNGYYNGQTQYRTEFTTYNAKEDYFAKSVILLGTDSPESKVALREGVHDFEFEIDLPTEVLITSFEGSNGHVRYWLDAEIDKAKKKNVHAKHAFTVICPIDINLSTYKIPVSEQTQTTVCCCWCKSGPISISARTDRSGYCPGESIAISAEFINNSSRKVSPYATLRQFTTFLSSGKKYTTDRKYTTIKGCSMKGSGKATWDAQLLRIPALPPTIENCSIIKMEYIVKVGLHIDYSPTLGFALPITIGTVPFIRAPPATQLPPISAQPRPLPPPPGWDPLPSMAPPFVYAESVGGAADIGEEEDKKGRFMYTPMYAFVNETYICAAPGYSNINQYP